MSANELEQLKKQVADLQDLVRKQTLLISKTGQSVLELQVAKQKQEIQKLGSTSKKDDKGSVGSLSNAPLSSSDYATNEDLVQLVGELQGQLDTMEDRSVRRVVNSTKTQDEDLVAPVPNVDGEFLSSEDGSYPRTVKEFNEISSIDLFRLAKFYELVPASLKEEQDFENYLEGKVENFHISQMTDDEIKKELEKYSEDQLDDLFDDLARFLGLRARRGGDSW